MAANTPPQERERLPTAVEVILYPFHFVARVITRGMLLFAAASGLVIATTFMAVVLYVALAEMPDWDGKGSLYVFGLLASLGVLTTVLTMAGKAIGRSLRDILGELAKLLRGWVPRLNARQSLAGARDDIRDVRRTFVRMFIAPYKLFIALLIIVPLTFFAVRTTQHEREWKKNVDTELAGLHSKLAGLKEAVADEVAGRVGTLISDHGDETTEALNSVNAAVEKTIKGNLAGLDGRIAEAVSNRLLAEGCTLTSTDECPPTPCPTPTDCPDPPLTPPEIESRYTFLYENARLDDDGEVTADSVGVKLAPRHRTRIDLLAAALLPCHQAEAAPVEFDVIGYASTAEFRVQPSGGTMPNSGDLNLEAANLRAKIVGTYLQDKGFTVNTTQWSLERPMQRRYQDNAAQALNRTVFIDLKSAGGCDLEGLER